MSTCIPEYTNALLQEQGALFRVYRRKRDTVEYTEYRDWYVALIFYKLLVLSFAEFYTYSLVKICMTNEHSCMHFWEMHIFVHLCEDMHGFLRNTQCIFGKYTYFFSSMKICMHFWEVHRVPSHMENWKIAYTAKMHALFSGWKQKRAPASVFCAFRWRVGGESQTYYKVRKCTVEIQFPFRKKWKVIWTLRTLFTPRTRPSWIICMRMHTCLFGVRILSAALHATGTRPFREEFTII